MSLKKWMWLGLTLLLIKAEAQNNKKFDPFLGIGISGGLTNYIGDLDDNFSLRNGNPAFGAHFIYWFKKNFAFKGAFLHGKVDANDQQGTFAGNNARNLSFNSKIDEIALMLQFHPLGKNAGDFSRRKINPYVFGGVALFRFNPKSNYKGDDIELQPLGTEGQYLGDPYPAPYKLTQISFPLGAGLNYALSQQLDLGVEIGFRKTLTDYLDDVSGTYPDEQLLAEKDPAAAAMSNRTGAPVEKGTMRGNPSQKDMYVYSNIHLTYYFYAGKQKMKRLTRKCFKFE